MCHMKSRNQLAVKLSVGTHYSQLAACYDPFGRLRTTSKKGQLQKNASRHGGVSKTTMMTMNNGFSMVVCTAIPLSF